MEIIDTKYLDLLERRLDGAQMAAATTLSNTVVSAGAGSGKTQTLSCRFAYLVLSCGIEAQKILTLTFTKKATGEMRERIYQMLEFFAQKETYKHPAADGSYIDDKTQNILISRAQGALDVFHLSHIQTLDSYCGEVLRSGAHFFGLSDDFVTGDIQTRQLIQDSALPFILERGDAISSIFTERSIQDFASDTFAAIIEEHTSLATEDGYFAAFLPKQIEVVRRGIEDAVCRLLGAVKDLKYLADNYTGKGKGFSLLREALENEMPDVDITSIVDISSIKEENITTNSKRAAAQLGKLLDWAQSIGCLTAPSGTGAIMSLFRQRKNAGDDITPVDILRSIVSFVTDLPRTVLLLHLLDDFTQSINTKKRKTGHLTFNDVNEMAMKTLLTQKEILVQENKAYNKIMIDEFQDNNATNRDLLFLLSLDNDALTLPAGIYETWQRGEDISRLLLPHLAKDKLFFVGDEKQSIYRFRAADVSVFNRLKEDLAGINAPPVKDGDIANAKGGGAGANLTMSTNYRSSKELLKSFNILFGGDGGREHYIFLPKAKEEAAYDSYEAYYTSPASAPKGAPLPCLTADNVAMRVAVLRRDGAFSAGCLATGASRLLSSEDQKAYYIAQRIQKLHDGGVSYKDIAILDRKRTHRKELLYWLRHFGIPFTVDQEARLFEDAVVNDVYNFLKLTMYPSDKNALASYLASPLVGLTIDEVVLVMASLLKTEHSKQASKEAGCGNGNTQGTKYPPPSKMSGIRQTGEYSAAISVEGTELQSILTDEAYRKYREGMEFYRIEREKSLKRPLVDTLDRLWYDCGMRYETMDNDALSVQYDMLFALCCMLDAPSGGGLGGGNIAQLTDSLAAIKKKEKAAFNSKSDSDIDLSAISYPLEDMDAVRVMTIYASKGLEFCHVFALGCFDMTGVHKQGDWQFDEYGVTFRPPFMDGDNYFYLLNRDRITGEQNAEDKRVLYVAVTRAISSITIVADIEVTKTPLEDKVDSSLMLAPFLESYKEAQDFANVDADTKNLSPITYQDGSAFDVEIIQCVTQQERDVRQRVKQETEVDIRLLAASYKSALLPPAVFVSKPAVSPSHLEDDAQTSYSLPPAYLSTSSASPLPPSSLGTLMHGVLQRCVTGGAVDNASMRILSSLEATYEEAVYSSMDAMQEAFLHSELYHDVVQAMNSKRLVYTEWPFMLYDGNVIKGKADLLYEDVHGNLVIVDYKSDKVIDVQKHKAQLMVYRKAASVLGYEDSKIKCVLCYINHGMKLVEIE